MKYVNCYIETSFDNIKKLQALGYKVDYQNLLKYSFIKITEDRCIPHFTIDPNLRRLDSIELQKDYSDKLELEKLVFSTNQENYSDDIDWILYQFEEDTEIDSVYVAERVTVTHKDIFNINHLIDNLEDSAYELCDEWSDNYLKDLTTDKKKEFEDLILNWMDKNLSQPNWFTVKKEKEISKGEFLERFN